MDVHKYIESGILELYCLGELSPQEETEVLQMMIYTEVKAEITKIQMTLEAYAQEQAIEPPAHMQDMISALIDNLAKEASMNRHDLPILNKFTNYRSWLQLVQDDIPQNIRNGRYAKMLTHTSSVMQMLLVSETDIEEELHADEMESFIILQGTCDCRVGDKVFSMKAGDFMEIPLHVHHDVKVHAPYVVAILQRIAV